MSNVKLTTHDARVAVAIKGLWGARIKATTTQKAFAQKYGFEQNFISQVFNFHSSASHAFICALAKELSLTLTRYLMNPAASENKDIADGNVQF
jgi:transcriptional regulator with XRE-family HTH domain